MPFYVIGNDGSKFGPAEVETLSQWAKEGRLGRETMVENAENGAQARARDIPGVRFPSTAVMEGTNDAVLKDPSQAPKRASGGAAAVAAGQPASYVAGTPERVTGMPERAPGDPARVAEAPAKVVAPYQAGNAQSSYSETGTTPAQPGAARGTAYNRNIDNGSAKLVTQAWVILAFGFFFGPIITPFAIYSANRALNMGNQDAQTPKLIAWILLAIQLVAVLILLVILLIGFLAVRNAK